MVHLDLDEDKIMVTSALPCPSMSVGKSVMRKRGRPSRHARGTSLSSVTPEGNNIVSLRPSLDKLDISSQRKRGRLPNHVTYNSEDPSQTCIVGCKKMEG